MKYLGSNNPWQLDMTIESERKNKFCTLELIECVANWSLYD